MEPYQSKGCKAGVSLAVTSGCLATYFHLHISSLDHHNVFYPIYSSIHCQNIQSTYFRYNCHPTLIILRHSACKTLIKTDPLSVTGGAVGIMYRSA